MTTITLQCCATHKFDSNSYVTYCNICDYILFKKFHFPGIQECSLRLPLEISAMCDWLAVAFWLQLVIFLCSLYNWTVRSFSSFPQQGNVYRQVQSGLKYCMSCFYGNRSQYMYALGTGFDFSPHTEVHNELIGRGFFQKLTLKEYINFQFLFNSNIYYCAENGSWIKTSQVVYISHL